MNEIEDIDYILGKMYPKMYTALGYRKAGNYPYHNILVRASLRTRFNDDRWLDGELTELFMEYGYLPDSDLEDE